MYVCVCVCVCTVCYVIQFWSLNCVKTLKCAVVFPIELAEKYVAIDIYRDLTFIYFLMQRPLLLVVVRQAVIGSLLPPEAVGDWCFPKRQQRATMSPLLAG